MRQVEKDTIPQNGEWRRGVFEAIQEYGKWNSVPVSYAVRNILAYAGTNPIKLDPERDEVRTSMDLVRSWVSKDS